jgi:hypothetical protein
LLPKNCSDPFSQLLDLLAEVAAGVADEEMQAQLKPAPERQVPVGVLGEEARGLFAVDPHRMR